MRVFILLIFLSISISSIAQSDIYGYYSGSFANGGNYSTQIQLNSDSTFKYEFKSDLTDDYAKGKFRFNNDTVYLIRDNMPTDTNYNVQYNSNGKAKIQKQVPSLNESMKLLSKKNKLYVLDLKGKFKKVYVHGHKLKRYFLSKHEGEVWQKL